uniref:Uncharacterized protein n=1 Tax=Trichogramma kaykai TaxID=54128 RepID=A0ABD2WFU9_9HYME
MLPEFVTDPRRPAPSYEQTIPSVVQLARSVGGEGFQDIQDSEILDLVLPGSEVLTVTDIEEIINQADETVKEDEEKQDDSEQQFHFSKLKIIINSIQSAIDEAMAYDPIMIRSLRFKYNCELALQVYEDLHKNYLRQMKQTEITQFFKK